MRFLDSGHPFFRPLWVRILVVAIAAGWGAFECVMGATGWGILFFFIAAYAAWDFFVAVRPKPKPKTLGTENSKTDGN